ncbi:MAG: ATP-binding protein [Armatimonadetes bacterium]|nr:ATP-binding protein [Armatimonadota bacterium]
MRRLEEPAPGRVQVLTGPRQVGKTGILLEIARRWGESAIYLALDAPEALLPGWWELQWRNALQKARAGKTLLLLDEAQYFPDWSRLVKVSIDQVYRSGLPLHIVVTGSATLQVGAGTRETMAGRFERLALRQWLPRDIADIFALSREEAVRQFVRSGSFPGGVPLLGDRMRWKAYLRDSIIDPAVGRDLLMLELVRKPALLRQIFAICVEHPSEILSLNKIAGSILDPGALETIAHYLGLLEETYLVSAVRKFSQKEIRRRASPPKVIPLSNAFLSASLSGDPPLPETHPALWGRWVENACLAFAVNCEQSVHYWREEPLEVDAVLTGSWGLWAVEIKTGGYTAKDLTGLLEFCRRWPEYRPLVLCDLERIDTARRLGIACLPWQDFLWQGL